jgi:hypothetical protein
MNASASGPRVRGSAPACWFHAARRETESTVSASATSRPAVTEPSDTAAAT